MYVWHLNALRLVVWKKVFACLYATDSATVTINNAEHIQVSTLYLLLAV